MILIKKKLDYVLLVDDDKATNFINQFIVKKANITEKTETLLNGKEALDFLMENCKKGNTEDEEPRSILIFLDINMPVMDGWEFLDAFHKSSNKIKDKITIVLLTSSANPDDKLNAEVYSELSDYKNKPLTASIIDEIIQEYFTDHL